MAEYILKDRYGKDHTYNDETIYVRGVDGELMPFTQGTSGGSSDDVRYVTFMSRDGLTEYGKKAVAVGDDCADPIARGVFNTPTRESDAQYNYTFYGWATTPNGAADSSALKAVEEDRTVYANFASAVRYYTISYYDGDNLLTTRQVAYGGSDNYTPPAKDGCFFNAWNPKPENITGDISCYAQYVLDIDFATASWQEIAAISESGEAETYFALGDKKALTFKSVDGSTYTVNMEICGFNHDTLESGGKVGITLIADVFAGTSRKHSTDTLPDCNWDTCELRGKMSDILSSFPAELKNLVKPVVKQYGYQTSGSHTGAIGTVVDKVWIPSVGELGLPKRSGADYIVEDGSPYPSFNKKRGTTNGYWLRGGVTSSSIARATYYSIDLGYGSVINPVRVGIGVLIGFCI